VLKQWSAVLTAAALLTACATVTVRPEGGPKTSDKPDYQASKNYFFWGLAGEHTIDVQAACAGRDVEQFQSQSTFVNGLLGGLTLGIYAPKTAKVWCIYGGEQ
jgi:hypothetical protein